MRAPAPATTQQRVLCLAGWAALAAALLLSVGSLAHQAQRPAPDFATRYAAGQSITRHQSPYDLDAISALERPLVGYELRYPFRDPPPVAWAFRVVSAAPYHPASRLWLAAILLSAAGCAWLACGLVGRRVRGLAGAALVAVLALDFGPLHDGLSRLQIDPLIGVLVLLAATLGTRRGSGLIQAIATMKPQTALLSSLGGVVGGRWRFAVQLLAGWALLIGSTQALATHWHGTGWGTWIDAVRGVNHGTQAWYIASGVAVGLLVLALAWRTIRAATERKAVVVLAVAAALNGSVAPFLFLNSHSAVLLIVPVLLLAGLRLGRVEQVALAAATGVLSVSGLSIVATHSGVKHALLPVLILLLLCSAGALIGGLPLLPLGVLAATNALVTIAPLPVRAYDWLTACVGVTLLVLLLRASRRAPGDRSDATGAIPAASAPAAPPTR